MSFSPTAKPVESILHSVEVLGRDALRERVKAMTAVDLDRLIGEMNDVKELPEVFKDQEVQQALEQRMEELHVKMDVQDRWKALRTSVEQQKQDMETKAEDSFVQKILEKGGGWAVVSAVGISILAWLGFKKAKKLKDAIDEKGFLKTAIEGAKEHPILAGILAAIGVKAGTEAYQYFTQNGEAIEKRIVEQAQEKGTTVEHEARTVGDTIKNAINTSTDIALGGLVKGLSLAIGGKYDEETGVVTIPGATLRPPVMIAFQAGMRRRLPKILVENKLKTILNQTRIVGAEVNVVAAHQHKLAGRALELMKRQTQVGFGSGESRELGRILDILDPALSIKNTHIIDEVRLRPDEARKHITALMQDMDQARKTEIRDFRATQQEVHNILYEAEKRLATGDFVGDAKTFKEKAIRQAKTAMAGYQANLTLHKSARSRQFMDAVNQLSGASDVMDMRGRQKMESATFDGGSKTKFLEASTKKVEQLGYGVRKIPGGRFAMGAVMGYSFLPLAMEGIAALRAGEKGGEARKAFALDVTEAGMGFVPIAGEFLDFKTAMTGEDLNGRKLSTMSRVTAGVMGTLGTASIGLGFFTGGLSIVGFRAIRGALATRKAVKVVKMANNGAEISGVTNKSIKAIKASQKNADKLEKMLTVTEAQRKAQKMRNIVSNAQRGMQLYTYGHLGFQVATGAMNILDNTENFVTDMQQRATHGVEAVENFVGGITPPSA